MKKNKKGFRMNSWTHVVRGPYEKCRSLWREVAASFKPCLGTSMKIFLEPSMAYTSLAVHYLWLAWLHWPKSLM